MNLQSRIGLMKKLGDYLGSDEAAWLETKKTASLKNAWFTLEFIDEAVSNIRRYYLDEHLLAEWIKHYELPAHNTNPKKIGIVMAGNIPLAGFHDMLCVYISGHVAVMKPSSKDELLIKHLVEKLIEWDERARALLVLSERLNNCDAYIATGSNNSSRYFEYYFARYPHIIRHNRTSVAILDGAETREELEQLADDINLYFGLGCRNVTKIYVPEGYDFVPLLGALKKYSHLHDHHKYRNNYDYNLAIHLLNKKFYMTNGSHLIVEDKSLFSPISQVNFEYYSSGEPLWQALTGSNQVQAIVGKNQVPFGKAQQPTLSDYADGIDTLGFVCTVN